MRCKCSIMSCGMALKRSMCGETSPLSVSREHDEGHFGSCSSAGIRGCGLKRQDVLLSRRASASKRTRTSTADVLSTACRDVRVRRWGWHTGLACRPRRTSTLRRSSSVVRQFCEPALVCKTLLAYSFVSGCCPVERLRWHCRKLLLHSLERHYSTHAIL